MCSERSFGAIFLQKLVLLLLIAANACGCRAALTNEIHATIAEVLLTLELGIPQGKLEALLGARARPEFTALRDQMNVRCVSYYFASYRLKYFFVFTNDAMVKIIQMPRFEHELSTSERGKRPAWKSHDPEERMEVVLQAPNLGKDGIRASMEGRYKSDGMDNALPGALIAGIIGQPVALAKNAVENQELRALADKFDPNRVTLGMTSSKVDELLGAPIFAEKSREALEMRYYGSARLGAQNPLLWISVVFRDDKVTRVFSDDFFNYRKIENLLKKENTR